MKQILCAGKEAVSWKGKGCDKDTEKNLKFPIEIVTGFVSVQFTESWLDI
jgi:hypothetical protein